MSALLQNAGFLSVGSLPPVLDITKKNPDPDKDYATPAEVQAFWKEHLKPGKLDVVTGGEVHPELQVWVAGKKGYSNRLAVAAGVPDWIENFSTRVWHYPVRLAAGLKYANRNMRKEDVPTIGFARRVIEDRKAFDAQNYDGTEFSVSLASPVAYRMFSGAMFTNTYHIAARIVEELWELYESPEFGREKFESTLWQWEVPFEMIRRAYRQGDGDIAALEQHFTRLYAPIQWIMEHAPKPMRGAFHPCPGDLGGLPVILPPWQTANLNIAATNAFSDLEVWGDGENDHRLVSTHCTFGDGLFAPKRLTLDELRLYEQYFRPRRGTIVAWGLLNNRFKERQLPGMVDDARELVQIGASKGVEEHRFSTHCGCGRKTVAQTIEILQQYHTVKRELTAA